VVYFENLNRWTGKCSVSAFSIGLTSFREQEAVATILFPAYLVVKIHEANVAFLLQIFKIKKNILGLETWSLLYIYIYMYIYPLSFMLLGCVVIHPERPSPEDKQMG
jgi:hypothetical protein